MSRLGIEVVQGTEIIKITHEDVFDGCLTYRVPESIGDTDSGIWAHDPRTLVQPQWTQTHDGGWEYSWEREGLLRYTVRTELHERYIDIQLTLQNLHKRTWEKTYAFPCLKTHTSPQFVDYDGARTHLRVEEQYTPITKLRRKDSDRPTMQFWYVDDADRSLGVVESFDASPDFRADGFIAVRSWDHGHLVVVTSDKPLFLFSNLEFSCVHCCPGFGTLEPGEMGIAVNRIYVLPDTRLSELDDLLRHDLPQLLPKPMEPLPTG